MPAAWFVLQDHSQTVRMKTHPVVKYNVHNKSPRDTIQQPNEMRAIAQFPRAAKQQLHAEAPALYGETKKN